MAWTATDLTRLEAAIARGEKTVQFADRSVTYRSLQEMLEARKVIADALDTTRPSRVFYVAPTRGL